MTLENIINYGRMYEGNDDLAKRYITPNMGLKEIPANGLLPQILQMTGERRPHPTLIAGLEQNPGGLVDLIITNQEQAINVLKQEVPNYLNEIVDGLTPEALQIVALKIPENGKIFPYIGEKIQKEEELTSQDINLIKTDYISQLETDGAKNFISNQSEGFFKERAPLYVLEEKTNFAKRYMLDDEENLDLGKTKDYIENTINSYDNDDLKTMAYIELGKNYAVPPQVQEQSRAA